LSPLSTAEADCGGASNHDLLSLLADDWWPSSSGLAASRFPALLPAGDDDGGA
jgi:hypothetical protein